VTLARLTMCADRINKKYSDYTLMDAGCRTMALRPLLKDCREYYGSDLIPAEGVLACNLEEPLPFADASFDIVTALDVLEHLNNPHLAFKELTRIARKAVFVSLPNMHYIKFRMNFMMGKGISGKYAFHTDPVLDRHRWVPSYSENVNFIQHNAGRHKVEYEPILPKRGRTRIISEPLEKTLGSWKPDLFNYGVLFEVSIGD
jgi:SAM-dependent methyltransferase